MPRMVTVSFGYYIKMFCCSEIYPTWPEQSIRANIYCQISLALNRVYTEWYLSKGYDFQITNSTQYDQYYVDGRSIADNVSKIVDEIFNVYVRRPGTHRPLLYGVLQRHHRHLSRPVPVGHCEPGQPGVQRSADPQVLLWQQPRAGGEQQHSGYSPVLSRFPLRVGSTGNAVRTIQRQLTRIRKNFPSIPSIPDVDGIFGPATEAAVRQFQSAFQLTSDGIVGKATWYKISYIYVSVKKLAELGSEGVEPDGLPPGWNLPRRTAAAGLHRRLGGGDAVLPEHHRSI